MGDERKVVVSALQFACSDSVAENVATAERLVRAAHKKGANIILIQELFEGYYFCQAQREDFFQRAKPCIEHPTILRMQKLAKELGVVIPVSFFEESNNAHYNSIAITDADGIDLGLYRKSHNPDGPGYQEKFYFNPGDTGFMVVFTTKFAKIGVAICWDQWFLEAARAMVLQGAEVLFYPTAIGFEPQDAGLDSREHWKRVMQEHAWANLQTNTSDMLDLVVHYIKELQIQIEVEKLKRLPLTKPLEVTFTGMILSSFDGGYVPDCISNFEHVKDCCSLNIGMINAMLKIYGRNDMFAKARELFESIKGTFSGVNNGGQPLKPDAYTYTSMLEASISAQQWDYFEYVYKEMALCGYQLDQTKHGWLLTKASKSGKVLHVYFLGTVGLLVLLVQCMD